MKELNQFALEIHKYAQDNLPALVLIFAVLVCIFLICMVIDFLRS